MSSSKQTGRRLIPDSPQKKKKKRFIGLLIGLLVAALLLALALGARYYLNKESAEEAADSAPTAQPTEELAAETPAETEAAESETEAPVAETVEAEEEVLDTPLPTGEAEEDNGLPDIDITSWEFILANATHNISDYAPELATLEGEQFDVRMVDAMQAFAEAARAEGLSVYLSSGYRDYATQTYLYNRKVEQVGAEKAGTIVAVPGTSEHQTGLCCDITDRYYETKTTDLENTALYQWMYAHCAEYGFILRFPEGKEDITGIIYEPWHFRYVGVEAATYIMENNLCLEEFEALYGVE